ncbi:hypothetical protein [Candidatus Methanoperedens nitratireducens]|uniref:Uncharacterized protein n=1 Tax=Candidatus Methanoperedens nitratireducens TaxID=1392998 RepID=A0A284VSK5_9EURY|nr:hypothetical protein [Candidatus Methanoperedens nitroreducens]SNQ62275.1 hypothetical protein MNV_660013 [Candidatus Methanoperedens nitroreducens]
MIRYTCPQEVIMLYLIINMEIRIYDFGIDLMENTFNKKQNEKDKKVR